MRVKQAAGNESAEMKNKNAERTPMVKKLGGGDHEEDSTGSSSDQDMESPRSTVAKARVINYDKKWNNNNINCDDDGDGPVFMHSQILRIRAEDSHIGEDIINHVLLLNLCSKDGRKQQFQVLLSKPILFHLPASPLSACNSN